MPDRSLLFCVSLVCFAAVPQAIGESLQERIDRAAAAGGGVVDVPPGVHESPALLLRRGVTLRLAEGAVLKAKTSPAAYAPTEGHAFILAEHADNVSVEGPGVIDGAGDAFADGSLDVPQQPRLVWLRDCRNVRVENVTLRNGRRWTLYLDRCDGAVVRKVKIRSTLQKCCDGIDLECRNALVEDCDIDSQDDAICFKNRSSDYTVCNVEVRNCRLATNSNFIKVGTETLGTIRDICVHHCTLHQASFSFLKKDQWPEAAEFGLPSGPNGMVGVSLQMNDGGILENVRVHDLEMVSGVGAPFCVRLTERGKRVLPGKSALRNVVIENVRGRTWLKVASSVIGTRNIRPQNIFFRNIDLEVEGGGSLPVAVPEIEPGDAAKEMWLSIFDAYGFCLRHADGVRFENVILRPRRATDRPLFTATDCTDVESGGLVSDLEAKCSAKCAGEVAERCAALSKPVLGSADKYATWSAFYERLFALDAAADEEWTKVSSVPDFDARREALRRKMMDRIGGFPEKTPLNAKITGIVRRSGYRVEKILFESRPGMYVTGNLYVPEDSQFPPPHPAAVELCGHARSGKASPNYRRIAVLAAKNGVAAFVVDPLGQGERFQSPEEESNTGSPVENHLRMGVNAMLLGHNLAAFEIWDAMRALDYLGARSDIRHDGYGAMGNSGGGTQSVVLSALDGRIKATATSCFLSNLREQTMWRLLADSEQLVFGQLADGINHAAYPLLGGNPVLMLGRSDDIIPYSGTLATASLLREVGRNIGREGWYAFASSPGPHGYNEEQMRRSVDFLSRKLRGEPAAFAEPEFDNEKQDFGPGADELAVTPDGRVQSLGGFKSVYDCLNEELDAAVSSRGKVVGEARAALVRKAADIDERRVGARTVVSESELSDGTRVARVFYEISDGYRMPVVEIVPPGAERHSPLVLAVDGARTNGAEVVRANGKRAMFIPDLCACGEIGSAKHHYACPHDDEETAKMLYLLGSSLVGRRAGELIALGKEAKRRFGKDPVVVTTGRLAVAAAHAMAAEPGLFGGHEFVNPSLSWTEAVRSRALSLYSTSVNGGLRCYDWVDLIPAR